MSFSIDSSAKLFSSTWEIIERLREVQFEQISLIGLKPALMSTAFLFFHC